jgi:hypothetical protein
LLPEQTTQELQPRSHLLADPAFFVCASQIRLFLLYLSTKKFCCLKNLGGSSKKIIDSFQLRWYAKYCPAVIKNAQAMKNIVPIIFVISHPPVENALGMR